jgi:hypothetical protein
MDIDWTAQSRYVWGKKGINQFMARVKRLGWQASNTLDAKASLPQPCIKRRPQSVGHKRTAKGVVSRLVSLVMVGLTSTVDQLGPAVKT